MNESSVLYTIDKLLREKSIFRVPDYQRGYAWKEKQCNDFWEDLTRIVKDKEEDSLHYVGIFSFQEIEWNLLKKENEFTPKLEKLKREGYKLYHVVDGQQRMTTLLILLDLFLNSGTKLDEDTSNQRFLENLIYIKEETFAVYKFGYEADDPSFKFFKDRIIVMPKDWNDIGVVNSTSIETYYTNNLENAKKFFKEKIEGLKSEEVKKYFEALRLRVVGIKNTIDERLNIYMIFETMNSRGVDLSNMELLKNRLIYLSTLLPKDQRLNESYINNVWKVIYKFLGFNKSKLLNDDDFLRNHWIMYGNYTRKEEEFYRNDLLSNVFIVPNINHENPDIRIGKREIEKYADSLKKSIGKWYIINNPESDYLDRFLKPTPDVPDEEKDVLDGFKSNWSEIQTELIRLNRLGLRYFEPLILASFVNKKNIDSIPKLLRAIERFLFLSFYVSMRRSDYGSATFYPLSKKMYHGLPISENIPDKANIDNVIKVITDWVTVSNTRYDVESLMLYLKDYFQRDKAFGYRNWNGINYFLQEYENYLRQSKGLPFTNEDFKKSDVEYIAPFIRKLKENLENETEGNLDKKLREYKKMEHWEKYTKDQIKKLLCSLGNLSLDFENGVELESKKERRRWEKNGAWTPKSILDRGLALLKFMEERWEIKLGDRTEKKKLLFLDFMEE
jgi:hypothetical protein